MGIMKPDYGWIVTEDCLDDVFAADDHENDIGVFGPRGVDPHMQAMLEASVTTAERKRWRALDDDGEVYYYGWYIGPDDETMFGPLEDFATPNAGATTIQYLYGNTWKTL